MEIKKLKIEGLPALIWGEPSEKMIIAAHGSRSSKEDDCIRILAEEADARGYCVVSFDLPQHGERIAETQLIMPDECVRELRAVYSFARRISEKIYLFGCSMGAYFELLAFAEAQIERAWFLSPVTDMERVICNLMEYLGVDEDELRRRVMIENDFETLYYPYFQYVRAHPVKSWPHRTHILRGEGDTLSEYSRVRDFCERFGCELTVQAGGEHWFHTPYELEFFRNWLSERF